VETRNILEAGVNPLLNGAMPSDSMMVDEDRAVPRRRPLSRPIDLEGLKEIIGLALGAPEFQRR
jgi:hypothetical protein